jgi:hypothetical protein
LDTWWIDRIMTFRLLILFSVFATGAAGFAWLKAEHRPSDAIAQAEAFVSLLKAGEFSGAYDLTVKNDVTGKTLVNFEALVKQQFCALEKTTTTFPFQSNGNRLRRWYQGRIIDLEEVTVEFTGSCLFGVTLRNLSPQSWKVSYFQSHAG